MLRRRRFLAHLFWVTVGGLLGHQLVKLTVPRPATVTTEVHLYRLGETGVEPVRWADQKPGDHVLAYWVAARRLERWTVTGHPFKDTDGVAAVPRTDFRDLGVLPEDVTGWVYTPYTDELEFLRGEPTKGE